MNKIIIYFKSLVEDFINEKISVEEFSDLFYKKFSNNEFMKPINHEEFKIINGMWGSLEMFEPNDEIRKDSIYINEKELREDMRKHLKKLDKKTKNQDNVRGTHP